MTLKEKIQAAWDNKGSIIEGFYNAYISASPEIKQEALKRLEICRSNTCGLYNPKGENTATLKAVFEGKESCGGCGCDIFAKTHSPSANCYLKELNKNPLWAEIMTDEQENEVGNIAYKKQFENRK